MIPQLKTLLILAGALALSLGGNAYQLYRAGKGSAQAAHAVEVCALTGQVKTLEGALGRAEMIAGMKAADTAELLATLDAIAERGQRTRVLYREAARAAPLPAECTPGQARIDAVNAALGGQP